jgi:hypothetical protein
VPSTGATAAAGGASQQREGQERNSGAQRGYDAMIAQGLSREMILDKLAHEVMEHMQSSRDAAHDRFADKKAFL